MTRGLRGLRTCLWLLGCVGCTEPLIATVGVTQQDAAQESGSLDAGPEEEEEAGAAQDARASSDAKTAQDTGTGARDAAPVVDAEPARDAAVDDAEAGPAAAHCIDLPDVIFASQEGDGGVSRVEARGIIASLDSALACAQDAQVNPQSTTYELADGGAMLRKGVVYSLAWPLSIMVLVTPIVGSDGACDDGTQLGLVLAAFANGCQEFAPSVDYKALRLPFEPSTAPLGMSLSLCESSCSVLPY